MVSSVRASSFVVHRFDDIDSTNDWLLAAARSGALDRTAAVADFQHQGRGRLDRRWEAPPGSALLCSVLLRLPLGPEDWHLAGVAVSLSAREAVGAIAPCDVGLKWPNDLVVGDRKLGGVLAETDGVGHDGDVAIVVGLGLNLSTSGPAEAGGTSLLDAAGQRCDRDQLLDAYLDVLSTRADELCTTTGRANLLEAYRAHLVTLGRRVLVTLHDRVLDGVATSITDVGHLVVTTSDGTHVVAAGDVVHVRAPHIEPAVVRE
jgi:BirA family transcriptional regulator, biotin operon repressor / biotin---[acetyl-CoA-carboxylase] ligase